MEDKVTIQKVINKMKQNNKKSDSRLILKAYEYSKKNHEGQFRKSEEPYIIHPLEVASILANIELDDATICAALLHDVVEDTIVTLEDVETEFGFEIAEIVDGVTKLRKDSIYYN